MSKLLSSAFCFYLFVHSTAGFAFYEAFPAGEGPYVSGPVSTKLSWPGENFKVYIDGQIIECSKDKDAQSHFDVTSGCLYSRHVGDSHLGFTDNSVFRAVFLGYDSHGRRIKWTDGGIKYRAYIQEWHDKNIPGWAGLHLFQRYRTSDDLYVASIRYDGRVTIKKKWNGVYTTLAQAKLDPGIHGDLLDGEGYLVPGRWIELQFTAEGRMLCFSIDGVEILSASSGTFSWGTMGIRLDYMDVYLDEWKVFSP